MPNPIIPVPKFPNVAQLPGVPQLIRANQAIGTVKLAVGAIQHFLGRAAAAPPTWGVFEGTGSSVLTKSTIGAPVLTPDSYLSFSNSHDWRVSDFPLQDGQFSTYNKVKLPPEISLKLSKGGSVQQRTALLKQVEAIAGSTKLYNILTPEGVYLDYNVTRFVLHRMGREGAYFFADLELFFRKIQQTASQYSTTTANTANAKNPVATPPQNQGTQFPQVSVPAAVQAVVHAVIANTPH